MTVPISEATSAQAKAAERHRAIKGVAARRKALWGAGYRPIPLISPFCRSLASAGKRPAEREWQLLAQQNPPPCIKLLPDIGSLNTGILANGLRILDIDIDDAGLVQALCRLAVGLLGPAPMRYRENSPRVAMLYRAATGEPMKREVAGEFGKIEILGRGQQLLAAGVHPSRAKIRWRGMCSVSELTAQTEDQIGLFMAAARPLLGDPLVATPEDRADEDTFARMGSNLGQMASIATVRAALAALPNTGPKNWDHWMRIGMASFAASGGTNEGFAAWAAWSAKHPAHDEETCRRAWVGYHRSPPTSLGFGTIAYAVKLAGGHITISQTESPPPQPPPPFSDTAYGALLRRVELTPEDGWCGGQGHRAELTAAARTCGHWIIIDTINEAAVRKSLFDAVYVGLGMAALAKRRELFGIIDWGIATGKAQAIHSMVLSNA